MFLRSYRCTQRSSVISPTSVFNIMDLICTPLTSRLFFLLNRSALFIIYNSHAQSNVNLRPAAQSCAIWMINIKFEDWPEQWNQHRSLYPWPPSIGRY